MASTDDVNSTLKNVVTNIGQEVLGVNAIATAIFTAAMTNVTLITNLGLTLSSAIEAIATAIMSTFPRIGGTFTLANATITVVTEPRTNANSIVVFTPTNGTAALTQRTDGLFHAANVAGASFSISTQANSATGLETFEYILFNPG